MRLLAVLLLLGPGPAAAQATDATFDIYVRGVRAGVIAIAGEERDGRYAVAGRLESAGIIGAVRDVRYDGRVSGRVSGTDFAPEQYDETYRDGGEAEKKSLAYLRGVPSVTREDEPGRRDVDPSTQGGTVDPLTAVWALLRDAPEGQACRLGASIYDGSRRSRLALDPPRREADGITCRGEYRRVAGYSDRDMRDPSFPFRVTYRPGGDGRWEVERIDMATILGRGVMVRR